MLAAKLLSRAAFERKKRQWVLELAQRRMAGEASIKMTAAQVAEVGRARAADSALAAALLRLDGMLALFVSVTHLASTD